MRNKLYEINFFELCSKKMKLMKQIHIFKKGLVIFLKGAPFSDFINSRPFRYSGGFFFQLGSFLIERWFIVNFFCLVIKKGLDLQVIFFFFSSFCRLLTQA